MPGMKATMKEFKKGTLHSGSKSGPVVKSRAQAIAIGMSEKRKGYAAGGTVCCDGQEGGVRGAGAANWKGKFKVY